MIGQTKKDTSATTSCVGSLVRVAQPLISYLFPSRMVKPVRRKEIENGQ
jgi:hypothetical protein